MFAYPTFTELFPTHLRRAGVGTSAAVGRIGASFGTLAMPNIATQSTGMALPGPSSGGDGEVTGQSDDGEVDLA